MNTKQPNTLYCATVYTNSIEVWKDHILVRSFEVGNFIKQLLWSATSRTLIIAAAENEDAGYLSFYHLDEQQEIHCLNAYAGTGQS